MDLPRQNNPHRHIQKSPHQTRKTMPKLRRHPHPKHLLRKIQPKNPPPKHPRQHNKPNTHPNILQTNPTRRHATRPNLARRQLRKPTLQRHRFKHTKNHKTTKTHRQRTPPPRILQTIPTKNLQKTRHHHRQHRTSKQHFLSPNNIWPP